MQNPVRGLLHGGAAIASVIGGICLWNHTEGDLPRHVALLVFALSLVALYTVSSLYHSVPWRRVWKHRMQRLDHSMIYVLVAGTYTPICVIVLNGKLGWTVLCIAWGIALLGIAQKAFLPKLTNGFSIALQTTQGWLALALIAPLAHRLPPAALVLVAAGGALYMIGLVFLVTRRPRLWPPVFSYHEMFHVLVVAGSALHYTMTFGYIA
jgi:hemolysin III